MRNLLGQVPEGQWDQLPWGIATDTEDDLVYKKGIGMIFLKIKISPL